MPKDSLRDKVNGNELDLSLSNLTVVPVREMAKITKATHIDLSCNLLTSLPAEFCSLTHIKKLDLSKNQLKSLPEEFGNLQKLCYLDLFGNSLTVLPIGFFRLKNLKWLDLRDNPLTADLKEVAGECLSEAECKQCARNVVTYMKHVQAEIEQKRQMMLQKQRDLEAARKAQEERERQQRKAEKLAEKERRRQEYLARLAAKEEQTTKKVPEEASLHQSAQGSNGIPVHAKKKEKGGLSCCTVCLISILALLILFVVTYHYCNTHTREPFCSDINKIIMPYLMAAHEMINEYAYKT